MSTELVVNIETSLLLAQWCLLISSVPPLYPSNSFFLLSLLICTGDYLLFFYLTHGVIFISELQSPLNSGPSSCLGILSSSEHVDFFFHSELHEGNEA